mmetsp:Transcript_18620/g.52021  ORF Transcript_18620/g.52021 Transcript_18620/m.52021 type:complete len:328 (-) Transcript_18620:225-1208(-)|eukprot:CAMPEP_0172369314 /NCGR_PEP_ID=MMETSP1060-20121228/32072_1 /TAXON_ID=37318 /ORGANISM="Pseudo-nitzschia pungens, Strain cf. cingulata" /LENGTH=327 /DNA_ID=CAMNT_0013094193 /DNA_START=47 /DNA_END=1030 /DNA_ORIENTATION=+
MTTEKSAASTANESSNAEEGSLVPSTPSGDDCLAEELRMAREQLATEKKLTSDLQRRLELKAVSIDCQLLENETLLNDSRAQLEAASQKNNAMALQIVEIRKENEYLLARTAALARRDQIQKAAIATSNTEVEKLMSVIENFQDRFQSLACGIAETSSARESESAKASKTTSAIREQARERRSATSLPEQPWEVERASLNQRIKRLEEDQLQMKLKFIDILTKHQSVWQFERYRLNGRIQELEQASHGEVPAGVVTDKETTNSETLSKKLPETSKAIKQTSTIETAESHESSSTSASLSTLNGSTINVMLHNVESGQLEGIFDASSS